LFSNLRFAILIVLCLLHSSESFADESDSKPNVDAPSVVADFLGKYCLECHGSASAEGEREFESFQLPIASEQQLITTDEIIDQVTLKTMPPEESEQPTDQERLALLQELRSSIAEARDLFEESTGRTVMRRLSNREYEVTLATLFGRGVDTLGLTADFPKEKTSQHIDTIGE